MVHRPEKEHHKQIRALAVLFERYPEHKKGEKKVSLTLMGGARHPADQARVETLKKLAADLKVQVSPFQLVANEELTLTRTTSNFS